MCHLFVIAWSAILVPYYICQLTATRLIGQLPWMKSHHCDVIMGAMVPQITSLTIDNSTVYSGADQRKLQSSESLAFVRGIHR